MAKRPRIVTVRENYLEDVPYRECLREAFRQLYILAGCGRLPFFEKVIYPTFRDYKGEIWLDTRTKITLNLERLEKNLRILSDYVSVEEKHRNRNFDVGFLRVFDAFMQIKDPKFNAPIQTHITSDAVGEILGNFLKDPSAQIDRSQLALNAQDILGIYEYEDVNTHQKFSGSSRIVTFLAGDNVDYLRVIDFMLAKSEDIFRDRKQYFDIVSGICIPGDEFSPLIMRSNTYQTRHVGLLYTAGDLVDMAGGLLDDLIFEVFTTNQKHKGSEFQNSKFKNDPLIAKALDIHYGPKLRRNLKRIVDMNRSRSVRNILDNIELGML